MQVMHCHGRLFPLIVALLSNGSFSGVPFGNTFGVSDQVKHCSHNVNQDGDRNLKIDLRGVVTSVFVYDYVTSWSLLNFYFLD